MAESRAFPLTHRLQLDFKIVFRDQLPVVVRDVDLRVERAPRHAFRDAQNAEILLQNHAIGGRSVHLAPAPVLRVAFFGRRSWVEWANV